MRRRTRTDHGRPCFDTRSEFPDIEWLRRELGAGRIRGFGELEPQYIGMSPDDERLEPYWQLAEEFDIPIGIHMGPGPPGAAYDSSPAPFKSPRFRMAAGDPSLLEGVLLRHKRLRLFVMHAGWPRLHEMMALLYAHPNVYVDVAGLQSPMITPRAGYLWYLERLVESGFAGRIMFGSDFQSGRIGHPDNCRRDLPECRTEGGPPLRQRGSIPAPFGIHLRAMSRPVCSARSYGLLCSPQ
jgi:predicted TIM-barrel fold metal-dependent hydrolase